MPNLKEVPTEQLLQGGIHMNEKIKKQLPPELEQFIISSFYDFCCFLHLLFVRLCILISEFLKSPQIFEHFF